MRVLVLGFLSAFLCFSSSASATSRWCPAGLLGKAVHAVTFDLRVEFGALHETDKIIFRRSLGWFRWKDEVLFEGKVTRAPSYTGKLPSGVLPRVNAFVPKDDAQEYEDELLIPFGTDRGVFVFSKIHPGIGLAMYNYGGSPNVTTFLIPGSEGFAVKSVRIKQLSLGDNPLWTETLAADEKEHEYAPGYDDRTHYSGSEVLLTLQAESGENQNWLLAADRPPRADFSDALNYFFGGRRAFLLGPGEYTFSDFTLEGDQLTISPRPEAKAFAPAMRTVDVRSWLR